jgi:hypothetical protein
MTSLRIRHVPRRVYGHKREGVAIFGTLEIHFDERGGEGREKGAIRCDDDGERKLLPPLQTYTIDIYARTK